MVKSRSYDETMRTALGFRAHSGWAAMIAAGGAIDAPRVLDRRRLVIADPAMPHARQPFHAAAELPLTAAAALVCEALASSRALAADAIAAAVKSLQSKGHEVAVTAVLWGSAKPMPELGRILASHALIHTAEGQMFREALLLGAQDCGVPVDRVPEKELGSDLLTRIDSLGRLLGPPWTQDQKYATLAALIALARH